MAYTVFGVFEDHEDAEAAINELEDVGYQAKDISIVMKDKGAGERIARETGTSFVSGATSGAATGAVIGGVAGLLIGVGAIVIPGIGGVLIGGPLATALGLTGAAATTAEGAITGALAGGLLGGLIGLGIPREKAEVYESRVKQGSILIAVPAAEDEKEEVRDILEEYGATDISSVSIRERETEERHHRRFTHH